MDNEKNDLVAAIEQVDVGTLASCVGLNFGKRDKVQRYGTGESVTV